MQNHQASNLFLGLMSLKLPIVHQPKKKDKNNQGTAYQKSHPSYA